MGNALIEQVLRRIRELDSQGENIARRTLTVACSAETKMPAASGEALEQAIRSHTGASLEEYVRWKLKLRETIGYRADRSAITIHMATESLRGLSVAEYLLDLSLGLKPPLDIERAELLDVRFDRPVVVRELPAGELDIIRAAPDPVEVVLSVGALVVRTSMGMILPKGLANIITPESLKAVFKSQYFDFVVSRSQMDVHYRLDPSGAAQELGPLHEWARIILLFVEAIKFGSTVDVVIHSQGQILFHNELAMHDKVVPPEIATLAAVVRDAWVVADRLGIQDSVAVPMRELMYQRERLSLFSQLLDPEPRRILVGGIFDGSQEPTEGSRVCIPPGTEVLLGEYKGAVVVSVWGEVTRTGREQDGKLEYEVVTAERRVEKVFAATKDDESAMSLAAAVNAVADSYDDVQCWILSQYAGN